MVKSESIRKIPEHFQALAINNHNNSGPVDMEYLQQ